MIIDILLMLLFMGLMTLLAWLFLHHPPSRDDPPAGGPDLKNRHATPPTASGDESTRSTLV